MRGVNNEGDIASCHDTQVLLEVLERVWLRTRLSVRLLTDFILMQALYVPML